jgi:hypothetical protein
MQILAGPLLLYLSTVQDQMRAWYQDFLPVAQAAAAINEPPGVEPDGIDEEEQEEEQADT